MQRLFVYGTLAPGRPNAHRLEEIGGSWKEATVTGKLYPDGWGATMGYPAIVPIESGEDVAGFVFSSEELADHWDELDEFEGEAYERVPVVATLRDNSTVDAYVYALRQE